MTRLFFIFSILLSANLASARIDQSLIDRSEQLRKCADGTCAVAAEALFTKYKQSFTEAYALIHKENGVAIKTAKSALLIHSYTMPANELSDIADILFQKGYNVVGIQLEGHRSRNSVVDLFQVSHEDWMADGHFGAALAKALGEQVLVVGYSLGGLLSTHLLQTEPDQFMGFVAIAPALGISIDGARFSCLGRSVARIKSLGLDPYAEQFLAGACAIRNLIDVVIPPKAPGQDYYLHLKKVFGKIKVPTLLAYTDTDEIVSYNHGIGPLINYAGVRPVLLRYTAADRVGHMDIINDRKNYEGRTLLGEIKKFTDGL